MGYNSWNDLQCEPDEQKLMKIAARLKELGLLELGYKIVTIDDCWMDRFRDERGALMASPEKFPSGMKALGDYVHSLGFKFGLYTSRGTGTCAGYPATMGNEQLDAETFAGWGVDFLKNDGCSDPDCGPQMRGYPESGVCSAEGRRLAMAKYRAMERALNSTGRPVVHAVCGWQPWYAPVGTSIGQMWRIGRDVRDWTGVYEATRIMEQLGGYHGPNSWNDPDMLLGSSKGSTLTLQPLQARAQFSLWAVFAAPLMLGGSVLKMGSYDLETYGNVAAIAVNQDPLGLPARLAQSNCPAYPKLHIAVDASGVPSMHVERPGKESEDWTTPTPWEDPDSRSTESRQCQQVWVKRLHDGEVALAAVNFAGTGSELAVPLAALGLPWGSDGAAVADLWAKDTAHKLVDKKLDLLLEADGGHVLLRLAPTPAS